MSHQSEFQESVACMPLSSMNKADHSGFETHRRVTRSPKRGYQQPHRKDLCPPKIKRKDRCVFLEMNPRFKLTVGNMGDDFSPR